MCFCRLNTHLYHHAMLYQDHVIHCSVVNEAGGFPTFLPYCDFMSDSIYWGPSNGHWGGTFCIVEVDLETGDLVVDSSSHPGVTGMAYLPSFEGSTSFWPCGAEGSSSCIGMAYWPNVVDSALWSLFSIVEGCSFCPAEAGIEVGLLEVDDMVGSEVVICCQVSVLNSKDDMALQGHRII